MAKSEWWSKYKSKVPPQMEGDFKIYKGFNKDPEPRRFPPDESPSEYHTALMQKVNDQWKTVMADSNIEIADGLPFVAKAYGKVLITGLGLGIVPHMLMDKPNIDRIVIIERNAEVVEMVKDYLPDGNITIVISDAFTFTPLEKFDCAWHDIWTTIGTYMPAEIERLIHRYDKYVDGFQMGWLYEATRALKAANGVKDTDALMEDPANKQMMEAYLLFEDEREKYKDKTEWDTTTKSKIET